MKVSVYAAAAYRSMQRIQGCLGSLNFHAHCMGLKPNADARNVPDQHHIPMRMPIGA